MNYIKLFESFESITMDKLKENCELCLSNLTDLGFKHEVLEDKGGEFMIKIYRMYNAPVAFNPYKWSDVEDDVLTLIQIIQSNDIKFTFKINGTTQKSEGWYSYKRTYEADNNFDEVIQRYDSEESKIKILFLYFKH